MGELITVSPDEVFDEYFACLCGLVGADDPDCSYKNLCWVLMDIPFKVVLGMDENRSMDAQGLRADFISNHRLEYPNIAFMDVRYSSIRVFEVLIALAYRINDDVMWDPDKGDRAIIWFWEMIQNLQLDHFEDSDEGWKTSQNDQICRRIVQIWIDRDYNYDGFGGLFPLKHPQKDQRNVEIWYQMHAYFLENYPIGD